MSRYTAAPTDEAAGEEAPPARTSSSRLRIKERKAAEAEAAAKSEAAAAPSTVNHEAITDAAADDNDAKHPCPRTCGWLGANEATMVHSTFVHQCTSRFRRMKHPMTYV